MTAVWELSLPDSEKIVMLALADCANDEGLCWPSIATLTRKCSKGERTIQGVIKSLAAKGYIERDEIVGKGCKYRLHPQRLRPAENAPREECPPQPTTQTPAATADKPLRTIITSEAKASSVPPECELIVQSWNVMAKATDLSLVAKLTDKRRSALRARLRSDGMEAFSLAIGRIPRCPFLLGQNERGWTADFDFLLKPDSVTKILEGKYDGRPGKNSSGDIDRRTSIARALDRRIDRAEGPVDGYGTGGTGSGGGGSIARLAAM